MKIKQLDLVNYRNYEKLVFSPGEGINILLGENAQGKTNALEAVYYAAISHSHRTSFDEELIKQGEEKAFLRLFYDRLGAGSQIDIRFSRSAPRQIFINQQKIKVRELIGRINAVLFSPEDLFLIKGAPQGRRRFLNAEISQASPSYFHELSVYVRLISQRNSLLKKIREKKASSELLEPWDGQLAALAARITAKRLAAVKKLNHIAGEMQNRLSGQREKLEIIYEIHGAPPDLLAEELVSWYNIRLKERRELDILRGSTSVGPQRDDLIFLINGENLRSYGSQGQQRTGILALKLAELEFLHSETGEYPVLLLDDVMSELDSGRRLELLAFLQRESIQTFITATEPAYFPEEFRRRAFYVKNGHIEGPESGGGELN